MSDTKTVFIGGPRAVTRLDKNVQARLLSLVASGCHVIIGDAAGVDKSVQQFLSDHTFRQVKVYASNGTARNNIGDWPVVEVSVPAGTKGFDFYACKDKKMALDADMGFMIWNGKSRGTFENIVNLAEQKKPCLVYYTPRKEFFIMKDLSATSKLKYLAAGDEADNLKEPASQFSLFVH